MGKVIQLDDLKNKQKLHVEKKAYDLFGALKINDDVYIVPKSTFITCSIELQRYFNNELGMGVDDILDTDVIDEINSIVDMPNERITIMVVEEDDELTTFEIHNVTNNKGFMMATQINNDYDGRHMITALVAGAIGIRNIDVIFFEKLNYEELVDSLN